MLNLTHQQREQAQEIAQLDPSAQAERIQALLAEGLEPDPASFIMNLIRIRHRDQAWEELGPGQKLWARSSSLVAENYSWRMRKLLGMSTIDMDKPPPLAGLRRTIIDAANGLGGPYIKVIDRGRELEASQVEALYSALGDDADRFAKAARQGHVVSDQILPHAGAMHRQGSPQDHIDRFERIADGSPFPVVEAGILPLVAALNSWGIRTTQSCEGHEKRGTPAPWVMFDPADEGKMQRLLDETKEHDWMLRRGGGFCQLKISGAAEDQTDLTPSEREHLPEFLARARSSADDLAARIDGLGVEISPKVELSKIDEAGSMEHGHGLGLDDVARGLDR